MNKTITFTISCGNNCYGIMYRIVTKSLLADESDKNLVTDRKHLFDEMVRLSEKYNNHKDGCIGVIFDVD